MEFENRYSLLDRTLHRLAFLTRPAQAGLADLEDRLFDAQCAGIGITRPVFITALPRAGTTLLLELCASLDDFAAHSYRDMPFVLTPMLWNRFAERFRQSEAPRERAHGDGILVDLDSPEALEEVVWKLFWGPHYQATRIVPWSGEADPEFSRFLRQHMRKIVALRRPAGAETARYVSKNNLNIARLPLLRRMFPDAILLVPFREPLQHAASLLRQHRNFLAIHRRDRFARDYMAAIGHHDFGEGLRPVDFDGWLSAASQPVPTTLSFWLQYWTATYGHLLRAATANVTLLSFERLCAGPEAALARLVGAIGLDEREALVRQAAQLETPPPHPVDTGGIPGDLLDRATAIHESLCEASIV